MRKTIFSRMIITLLLCLNSVALQASNQDQLTPLFTFSFESTAESVLNDASDSIEFKSMLSFDDSMIMRLWTPLYCKPIAFSFFHEDQLLFAEQTYQAVFQFFSVKNNGYYVPGEKLSKLQKVTIYPMPQNVWLNESQLMPIVNKWIDIMERTGWKRLESHAHDFTFEPGKFHEGKRYWEGYKNRYEFWGSCKGDSLYIVNLNVINAPRYKCELAQEYLYRVEIEILDGTEYNSIQIYEDLPCYVPREQKKQKNMEKKKKFFEFWKKS